MKHKLLNDDLGRRMASGSPFTYGELCALGLDGGRAADKRIQQWRKRGWIEFHREARKVTWTLTSDGIAETASLR